MAVQFVDWLQETIPEMEKSPNPPSEEKLKHYKRQVDFLKGVLNADKCEKVLASSIIPHGQATTNGEVVTQQIHQKVQNQATNKLRKELLGLTDDGELRNRKVMESMLSDNFQDEMAIEEHRRDKMVDDMIAMTRDWKEQSRVANKVIKKDLEVVDNSSKLADTNESQLKVESNRLAEFNKRTCNCWIWLMLIFICFSFISMVMFIRIFKKKVIPPT